MNFKKVNNITGWVVCLIACCVYVLTTEAGGSLWDCGEFVSSAYKLQIPHPPGAPLFVLLGRFFIILFGDNGMTAAKAVNIMNALASGFTILFLFWTITHFARKIVTSGFTIQQGNLATSSIATPVAVTRELTTGQILSIMGAGIVGALAYTFSDSFWYSAVEGEVYALSSFFTALVFWAILKWENVADEPGADKWIIFIFFMMGLSIGVHLLNLLTIPAIVMVYYFRRRHLFNYKLIRKYFIWVVIAGGLLAFFGALYAANREAGFLTKDGIDDYLRREYGDDVTISDSTLPGLMLVGTALAIGLLYLVEAINKARKDFYGGIYIFFVIGVVITGIVQIGVIQYSIKLAGVFDRVFVNSLSMPFFSGFTFFFLLLGVLIWLGLRYANRKALSYLRLSLWCVTFMLIGYSTYLTTMIRSSADPAVDMYNVDNPISLVGYLSREQYGDFPLLYGQVYTGEPLTYNIKGTKYQKGADKYVPIGEDKDLVYRPDDKMVFPRMWDASDEQGHSYYYSLFTKIDKMRDSQGRERYERKPTFGENLKYFIVYQNYYMYLRYFLWNFSGKQNDIQWEFSGNPRDGNWITGITPVDSAIYGDQKMLPDSLKNNKEHNKLFALPLILGIIGMVYHAKRKGSDGLVNFLMFFFTGFAIVIYLNQAGFQPRERDYAYVGSFYAFAVWIGLGVLAIKDWLEKLKLPTTTAAGIATLACLLAVPVIMAQQEWDDHDRSKKQLARDLARDYLEGCPKNAILFCFGDNDTYPLWYAQEVEKIRPDIRVINYSLLGIDWYINELRYKVNESPAIDVIWNSNQIEGEKRNYITYKAAPGYNDSSYYNLYDVMKNYAGSDDPAKMDNRRGDDLFNTFPNHKFTVPVNVANVRASGVVNPADSVVTEMRFDVGKNGLNKGETALLNIIAANQWKRPICFTSPFGELGFGSYIRKIGITYALVPMENTQLDADRMYRQIMDPEKFAYGNCNLPGVYFDEENRRHLNIIRRAHAEAALGLSREGKKDSARQVLNKADKMMLQENFPYGMTSRRNEHDRNALQFLQACYEAGDKALADKVEASVKKDLEQQIAYYNSLKSPWSETMESEKQTAQQLLDQLNAIRKMSGMQQQLPQQQQK
jgi:hypothetical protein